MVVRLAASDRLRTHCYEEHDDGSKRSVSGNSTDTTT